MRRWMLLAALVVGCSGPAESRLATGGRAVLYREGAETISLPESGDRSPIAPVVPAGQAVVVLDDPGGDDSRPVRVKVEGGDHDGLVATVRRHELRPAR